MDLKEKISKSSYLMLKNEIKCCAAVGVGIRKEADNNHGIVRAMLRDRKRSEGKETRVHYLAYALLKGRKHYEVEPTADPRYVPSADEIKAVLYRVFITPAYAKILNQELEQFFEPPIEVKAAE